MNELLRKEIHNKNEQKKKVRHVVSRTRQQYRVAKSDCGRRLLSGTFTL
jgi:hypothetical protein